MSIALRNCLPRVFNRYLFGDRDRWGLVADPDDRCWREWQSTYEKFYMENQREGVGTAVNDAGYTVMKSLTLQGKTVLEIGAGDIRHLQHWQGRPAEYILADVHQQMMRKAQERLREYSLTYRSILLNRLETVPLADRSIDVIVSFYSLEHLYPLGNYLEEYHRVLKPDGVLVGAIPSEGGFAWGAGRMLTTRRWFKRHTDIDPDKIICWEHPNFADQILCDLDRKFLRKRVEYWPFGWVPLIDCNLVIRFIYSRK